mmetsp:Transcript_3551/g.5655  ORF Transcript_3551/g.5655 Transcript_3551/m.5655 type:complete len:240 (-) Transcript_3551:612-1331(-)
MRMHLMVKNVPVLWYSSPMKSRQKNAISPLRDALWGEHKLCVLLPKTGVNPLQMMEQFKNNETTVMLATPNSVRGLDFPALTHVYTLYLPTEDPREYVHLAGRVGRVGQRGSVYGSGGRVVSILQQDDADKMDVLAEKLGFVFTDVDSVSVDDDISRIVSQLKVVDDEDDDMEDEVSDSAEPDFANPDDLDKVRRYLEDTVSLLTITSEDDEEENIGQADTIDVEYESDDEEDDDKGFQ